MPSAIADNRQWRTFDWPLLVVAFALFGMGLLAVYSASRGLVGPEEVIRQLVYLVPATFVGVSLMLMNYGTLFNGARWIYWGNIVLLALVLVTGHSALGAQRWINLGFMTIQPSEFAKLALIITLAKLLATKPAKDPRVLGAVALHVAIPAALIFKQPDLGTSLVFGAITLGMLCYSGLPGAIFFVLASPILSVAAASLNWFLWGGYLVGLAAWLWRTFKSSVWVKGAIFAFNVAAAFALPLLWNLLKPYQRQRLVVFMDPEADPLGSGYHIIQSKVAIGSGGLFGKGLFSGTQTQLHFIPEQHTDFVFSVIGEELGFLGGLLIVALFMLLAWRGLRIAKRAKDPFGALIAVGVVSMFMFHAFVNMGMTMGIMPVTGIPLPFLTAGGTSLLTNMAAIGLLLAVSIRRWKLLF